VSGRDSARLAAGSERSHADDGELVNLREIAEIELFILRRMKEFTVGDHGSVFQGSGFNFVGLRDWQPGDRMSSVDWAQSSLTNFSPMIMREFDQDSNATVMAVADASMSTRCGVNGVPIAAAIARSVAAVGLSALFFQDMFGLVTFDDQFRQVAAARPRIGRPHVIYCVDLYQGNGERPSESGPDAAHGVRKSDPVQLSRPPITESVASHLRKTSLVPVISDFMFADAPRLIRDLARLNAVHDVFLIMADVRFAYDLPDVSAGWIEAFDIESGRTRVFSRRELRRLGERVDEWQQQIMRVARAEDVDCVRVGLDRWEMESTLAQFAAERRLRKI
jgi:uncharacterized protein (DUF58 family)